MFNEEMKKLISNFTGTFKEFLVYVHFYFQKKIDKENKKALKDKYIKIRQNVLKYFIANERAVTQELSKRNNR